MMFIKRKALSPSKQRKLEEYKARQKVRESVQDSVETKEVVEEPKARVLSFKLTQKELELRAKICEAFPLVFNLKNPKPLSKRIHLELKAELTRLGIPFTSKPIYRIFKHWCSKLAYKRCLIVNVMRYDLSGNETEKITVDEKQDALQAMKFFMQEQEKKKKKR